MADFKRIGPFYSETKSKATEGKEKSSKKSVVLAIMKLGRLRKLKPGITISFVLFTSLAPSASSAADPPLPDPQQLKERALQGMKQSEKELERYLCTVNGQMDELNSDGSVKKHRSEREERFYIHNIEINHTLAKNGKELTGNDAKKEQERVDREVKKYSDAKEVNKANAQDEKEIDMFLRALRFTNGHRELRAGRSTVVYDLTGDPGFHPRKIEERFAQALTGRIWVDEQTGAPVEIRVQTDHDVKIGGGLVATVHKGFQLHVVQQLESGGVWITEFVEGRGDARAALFMHPRFRFSETLDGCRLFSVDTNETIRKPETPFQ